MADSSDYISERSSPNRPTSWKQEAYLVVLFVAVLVVGTAVILNPADAYLGPGLAFDQLGLRLAVGLGFGPTAVVPPLYPHYLAMFYRSVGYSHMAVLLSQVVLLAGLATSVSLIVRYIGLSPRYAWLAGLLTGFFPQAIALLRHFTPALLVAFLWAVGVHAWVRNRPYPSWFETVLAGMVFGMVLLGRFGLLVPIVVLLVSRRAFRGRLGGSPSRASSFLHLAPRVVLAIVVLSAVVAPWIVRNSRLYDELVFVDSTWAVRWRAATIPGEYTLDFVIPGRSTRVPDHTPILENRLALGDVVGFACAEPWKLVRIWTRRAVTFVGFSGWNDAVTLDRFPYEGPAYKLLQALVYGILLSFAAAWIVLLRARGKPERLLGKTWLALAGIGVITGGIGDIRVYALPLLVPIAMRGLWGLLVQLRVRLRPRQGEEGGLLRAYENTDPLPRGVRAANGLQWCAWISVVVTVWTLGVLGLLG